MGWNNKNVIEEQQQLKTNISPPPPSKIKAECPRPPPQAPSCCSVAAGRSTGQRYAGMSGPSCARTQTSIQSPQVGQLPGQL